MQGWKKERMGALSAAQIRARARLALRGRWKRALSVCAFDMLLMACWSYLAFRLLDKLLIPVYYSAEPQVPILPASVWSVMILAGYALVRPLYDIGMARTAHRIAMGGQADFSLIRVSGRDLFRGVRVALVCMWRSVLLPVMGAWLIGFVSTLMLYEPRIPDWVCNGLLFGSLLGAAVVMVCRLMEYLPVYQLMAAYPELSATEAVSRCRSMMKGKRGRLFGLMISFVLWAVLCVVFIVTVEEMLPALSAASEIWAFAGSFVSLPLMVYVQTALAVFTQELTAVGVSDSEEI